MAKRKILPAVAEHIKRNRDLPVERIAEECGLTASQVEEFLTTLPPEDKPRYTTGDGGLSTLVDEFNKSLVGVVRPLDGSNSCSIDQLAARRKPSP